MSVVAAVVLLELEEVSVEFVVIEGEKEFVLAVPDDRMAVYVSPEVGMLAAERNVEVDKVVADAELADKDMLVVVEAGKGKVVVGAEGVVDNCNGSVDIDIVELVEADKGNCKGMEVEQLVVVGTAVDSKVAVVGSSDIEVELDIVGFVVLVVVAYAHFEVYYCCFCHLAYGNLSHPFFYLIF